MAPMMAYWRTGFENSSRNGLSTKELLTVGTWNCGGLSKTKKDLCKHLSYDILCLTETHSWNDKDKFTIYSDTPARNDSWSGVALMYSEKIAKCVMFTGSIGSRIVYMRVRGIMCNLFIIGVYIPQKNRKKPDQKETYGQLEKLLMSVGHRDCIILLGDFNSRLSRSIDNRVGRWCIHNRRDAGGDRLLDILNKVSLMCQYVFSVTEKEK